MLAVHGTGVVQSRRAPGERGWAEGAAEEVACAVCHLDCHLAGLECDCSPCRSALAAGFEFKMRAASDFRKTCLWQLRR